VKQAGGEDGLGELVHGLADPAYAKSPVRRRCITPVNETAPATNGSSSPYTAGYHPLRRPDMVDSYQYSSSSLSSGRRSLPRLGRVLPPAVYPAAYYHHHRGVTPDGGAGANSHWTPAASPACSVIGSRPVSSAANSTVSGSADNLRTVVFSVHLPSHLFLHLFV